MLLETGSDKHLASSVLRLVYAFVVLSLSILFCGIASLCSSVICYQLLLLKNAFYIALYVLSTCFLLTLFLHNYSSKKKKPVNEQFLMSTISSFQQQQQNSPPPPVRPMRHIPIGGHALPGMIQQPTVQPMSLATTMTQSGQSLFSSLRARDRVYPISTITASNDAMAKQQQAANIIGGLKSTLNKQSLPEISNLIIKLFVIALSFPAMLYAVFRLAVAIEQYTPRRRDERDADPCLMAQLEIVQFILLVFLIPMQAFFVFKYGRVMSQRSTMVSAIALTHLLSTNFATWFEMFTVETTRFHFRASTAVYDYYPINSTAIVAMAKTQTSSTSYSYCFDSATTIRRASTEAAPFLYPLFTHYLLLVCIPLLRLLFAVSAHNCAVEFAASSPQLQSTTTPVHSVANTILGVSNLTPYDDGTDYTQANNESPCECRHSNKGVFVNLLVLLAMTSLILAAHFLSPPPNSQTIGDSTHSATVRLAYYTAQIAINAVVILALPLAWRGIFQLDRVPHRDFSPDPRRSVQQYNVARFVVTMITLAFTVVYYLAIIIVHSAALAQLVINYCYYHPQPQNESSTMSKRQIRYSTTTATTSTAESKITPSATVIPVRTSTATFFLSCPTSPSSSEITANEEAMMHVLASVPAVTASAIVASALAIGRAVSSLMLAISQVVMAILADCRSALTDRQLDRKPGRSLLMFILTASLIAWALEIAFELHTSSIGDAVAIFHAFSPSIVDVGGFIWPLFSVFTIPLMVAFRLFIAVWLYDNWLKCYSPTII